MKPHLTIAASRSLVVVLLVTHVALVAWLAAGQSPTVDEPAHLAAGMAMWQYGSFEIYCVNPPLMRAVATLPILFMPHEELWGDFQGAPRPRPEFLLGEQFVESHPDRWEQFLIAARWALLPFAILGGLFCYLWASELFGRKAGLLALSLWCFSPNILTWSSLICTDGVAAAIGVGAGYFLWRCLRQPTWGRAVMAGVFLGLAQLSKMTWTVLFAIWPAVWLLVRLAADRRGRVRPDLWKLAVVLLMGLYVLNLGYGFDGSFSLLGDFGFRSRLLAGENSAGANDAGGNRFAHSVLQWVPVPLPRQFVRGMDLQRMDFESGKPSYLFGEWSDRGWWYYYLVGLALKIPLGTWGLCLLAGAGSCYSWVQRRRVGAPYASAPGRRAADAIDLVLVLVPAFAVLILVSSQDGFSNHFRYVLPVLPFAFVWVGQVAQRIAWDSIASSALVLVLLGWAVLSSMAAFPHTMSYFNEVVGGPTNGHRYLLGSSFSWSQDQFRLRRWLRMHAEIHSPYVLIERSVSLERLGIHGRGAPPTGDCTRGDESTVGIPTPGPVPGWHIISVQDIHQPDGGYLYFLDYEPIARIGHSIHVYKTSVDDANRVRRTRGLPMISQEQAPPGQVLDEMVAAGEGSAQRIKVALFVASEVGPPSERHIRQTIECGRDVLLSVLSEHDIRHGELEKHDVLVVPGGKASIQGSALGGEGRSAIRSFVRGGGGYVGVCAGAYLATVNHEWSLRLINARTMTGERYVPRHGKEIGVSSFF